MKDVLTENLADNFKEKLKNRKVSEENVCLLCFSVGFVLWDEDVVLNVNADAVKISIGVS